MTTITYTWTIPPTKGSAFTLSTALISQADPDVFQSNPTLAVGDVKVTIDGGSPANITSLPTASGTVVSVSLSSAEMNGDVILVQFSDQTGAQWQDSLIEIRTGTTVALTATYCTVADVKTYLGITGAGDDALITALIARAQRYIDDYTGRTFAAPADETRYFTVGADTSRYSLYLPDDLCQITTVTTDADRVGGGDALTANIDYVTEPRAATPYYALKLLSSTNYSWTYTSDPEMGICIVGRFAYSITPPADVAHACVRLASYFYKAKDAQVFDTVANPEFGVITVPQGIPRDVKLILDIYKRVAL